MTNSQTNGTARNGAMAFTITCVVKPFVGAKFDAFVSVLLSFFSIAVVNVFISLIECNYLSVLLEQSVVDQRQSLTQRHATPGEVSVKHAVAMEKKLTWLRTDDGWTDANADGQTTVNFPSPRFIAQKVCFDFCRICSLDSFNSPPT